MTVKEIYDDVLVEINKENAQSFTIEEFNYVLNKAINTWANERYGFYAADQQLTDDLRVLIKEAKVNLKPLSSSQTFNAITSSVVEATGTTDIKVTSLQDVFIGKHYTIEGATIGGGEWNPDNPASFSIVSIDHEHNTPYDITITVDKTVTADEGSAILIMTEPIAIDKDYMNDRFIEFQLPTSDYFHPLSCKVVYESIRRVTAANTKLTFPAKRLTFDMYDFIQNNTYLRPHPNRPYYQVLDNPKNSGYWQASGTEGTAGYTKFQNKPTFKVYIGKDVPNLEPERILVYTLKLPEKLTLYDDDIFTFGEDNSQVVEFPDYLKNEFVRRITMYLLEKEGNPRIQTQPVINQDIPPVPLNVQAASGQKGTPGAPAGQPQQAQQRQQQG